MYTGHAGTGKDLCVGDVILPSDFHQPAERGCMEMVQLSDVSAGYSPDFTVIKECSDDYSLLDLELGAEDNTPSLPNI